MHAELSLVRPQFSHEKQARLLRKQLLAEDYDFLQKDFLLGGGEDWSWSELLDHYAFMATGENLRPGMVPSDYLFLTDGVEIVGDISIRYELTPALRNYGGNIGYSVASNVRGRGYATRALQMGLERLAVRGIDRALVTCSDDNAASAAVIEKNSGELENIVLGENGRRTRRYWISIA